MAEYFLRAYMRKIEELEEQLKIAKEAFHRCLIKSLYRICEIFPNREIPLFEIEEHSPAGRYEYLEILNTGGKEINRIGKSAILNDEPSRLGYHEPFSRQSIEEYVEGHYTGGRNKRLLAKRILEIIILGKLKPPRIERCYD